MNVFLVDYSWVSYLFEMSVVSPNFGRMMCEQK